MMIGHILYPGDVGFDASVSECTWILSALEALRNALYKCKTYLLTYLLINKMYSATVKSGSSGRYSRCTPVLAGIECR